MLKMFKKVQRDTSKTGNNLKTKAKECQKWLMEPDLKYRGTVCLPTIKYSKKLWKLAKPKARKHQHNPTKGPIFKLPPSFMMLPRELRQQILLGTYDLDNYRDLEPLHPNPFHDFMYLRAQHIGAWALNLRKVHPEIDLDMDFVNKTWQDQLHQLQARMTDEFNYVWDNLLFEDYDQLTPQQIVWVQRYRHFFVEMGVMADKVWWEATHPILKHVRKIPGLRRHIGVDTRSRMVWKHKHCYMSIAWHVMNGTPDDDEFWDSLRF